MQNFNISFQSLIKTQDSRAELAEICMDQALFLKGFLLNSSNYTNNRIDFDSLTLSKFEQWRTYNTLLAKAYTQPIEERQNIDELIQKSIALEEELVRTVDGFGAAFKQVNWQQVQAKLNPGEAVIEFVHYDLFKGVNKTDSTMYAAIVLKSDGKPVFVPIFEEKELLSIIDKQQSQKSDFLNELYASRGGKPRKSTSNSLLELNWQPLEPLLDQITTIYISPSGLLHRVNFGAIGKKGNKILADDYQFVRLGSARQLVVGGGEVSRENAFLFGGIHYDREMEIITENAVEEDANSGLDFSFVTRGEVATWNYLSGTAKEVEEIERLLAIKGINTELFSKSVATEETFKQIGQERNAPRILHLATHGFFFADPDLDGVASENMGESLAFKMSEHPMIRSGLILAGGNHVWKGNETLADEEDGILTAYEISQMNLSGTELVVLSACETGLGDIQGSEGVYGLQRAFKIAGAKYLIMSLWQVPDQETQTFMTYFYRKWLVDEMPIPQAFRATQQEMRKRYSDPFAWAGFILVE